VVGEERIAFNAIGQSVTETVFAPQDLAQPHQTIDPLRPAGIEHWALGVTGNQRLVNQLVN
jgi:hypothetical protein